MRINNMVVLIALVAIFICSLICGVSAAATQRADALVLVNSASASYIGFQYYIQPYLDNFGIPYTVVDIATSSLAEDVAEYAIVIIGHRQLDPDGIYLDATEQANISTAVSYGTGLVNFDNDLSADGSTGRYQFVQDIFNFGYVVPQMDSGVTFGDSAEPTTHYITARHEIGESIITGNMTLAGIILPDSVSALASTGSEPFLAVTSSGAGRAVQWGSYDWMSHLVKGPVYGLDDLVWRSIVWAARKPFVMQGLPNFVTMRVDDVSGHFWYVEIANEFGFKPWLGLFYQDLEGTGLPVMRFYASGLPNGQYEVIANLYVSTSGRDMRYYYGYTPNEHSAHFVDTIGGDGGSDQHQEYSLGTVNIVDGNFNLYVHNAELLSGSYPFFGWAWIRLVSPTMGETKINCWEDDHQDPVLVTTTSVSDLDERDGQWTEFLYTRGRSFPTVMAGMEEASGDTDAAKLSDMVNNGNATASVHSKTQEDFFYFDHVCCDFSDETIASNFALATAWHAYNNIPISKFMAPHFYELGTNVFQGLSDWGIEFICTHMQPGTRFHSAWLLDGPYRLYQSGNSAGEEPGYYADFITVPGHPEFDGQFFNCVTEIRDDAGYEWFPDNDVIGSIERGTRQTKRALDSMVLATLFTHDNFIQQINSQNWRAILQGITDNISSYDPIYVTMDHACQYVRAMYTSNITVSTYDPNSYQVTTTLDGYTDLPTKFYLFTEEEGTIQDVLLDAPTFSGPTEVVYQLTEPPALDHFTFDAVASPQLVGTPFSITITARDISGNIFTGYSSQASLSDSTGSINPSLTGNFTAGVWTGSVTIGQPGSGIIISASDGAAIGVSNSFDVEPVGLSLDHFTFDTVASPQLVGTAFSITITARDISGNIFTGYSSQASLSDSTGSISPSFTGNFTAGVWTGSVTIGQPGSGITISASDGAATGASNSFDAVALPVVEIQINCWEDNHQMPILTTTTSAGDLDEADGQWTEFLHVHGRNYPAILAGADEENYSLPVMRFYTSGVANGAYEVIANLYTANSGRDMRYYYGYTPGSPKANFVDTIGGSGGSDQFEECSLGTVNITDGTFNIYVQDADLLGGAYPFFGWAWIRLVPTVLPILDHFTFDAVASPQLVGTAFSITITAREISGNIFTGYSSQASLSDSTGSITPSLTGNFTAGVWTGSVTIGQPGSGITISASDGAATGISNSFDVEPMGLSLDHFTFDTVASPQLVGTAFSITITARDISGNIFTGYSSQASLSDSTGSISPSLTGNFTAGVWTGSVTIGQPGSGITISASDGAATGASNSFDAVALPVVEIQINCWEDNHQMPILTTTTSAGDLDEADGQWTEFLHVRSRNYPAVLAGADEENYSLPVMRFYTSGVANGAYEVIANLYTANSGRDMRYYYGYTPGSPKANFVDTIGGSGGSDQFEEYSLGTVNITDGTFNIYVQDADLLGGAYPFFGWAWIRLVPE